MCNPGQSNDHMQNVCSGNLNRQMHRCCWQSCQQRVRPTSGDYQEAASEACSSHAALMQLSQWQGLRSACMRCIAARVHPQWTPLLAMMYMQLALFPLCVVPGTVKCSHTSWPHLHCVEHPASTSLLEGYIPTLPLQLHHTGCAHAAVHPDSWSLLGRTCGSAILQLLPLLTGAPVLQQLWQRSLLRHQTTHSKALC
jgi:hypothetical protein